jgi:ABC-type sugar transport system substrate-binding protein
VQMRNSWKSVAAAAATVVAVATLAAGCGSNSSSGSTGSTSGSGASSSGGIANAKATVAKYAANPPLEVSPLPSPPKASTYAIQVNCTIPACAPGAMKAAMDALGWKFQEMTYDISKGPSALQAALTQAIAAKPDVILFGANFPEATFQQQIDQGGKDGIKFIDIGGALTPGYAACIQCHESLGALGALTADIALADAGSKIDIAVPSDNSIAPLKAEVDGIKQEVAKNGDGSKVLDVPQSVTATPAENASRLVSFLQRNPSVKYVIGTEKFLPPAALNSAGLGSRVKLVGLYPLNASEVADVKEGRVVGYAVGELASLYWRAADAAARAVQGVKVDPIAPIQSLRVMNKSNADVSLLDPANYQDIYKKAWQK